MSFMIKCSFYEYPFHCSFPFRAVFNGPIGQRFRLSKSGASKEKHRGNSEIDQVCPLGFAFWVAICTFGLTRGLCLCCLSKLLKGKSIPPEFTPHLGGQPCKGGKLYSQAWVMKFQTKLSLKATGDRSNPLRTFKNPT